MLVSQNWLSDLVPALAGRADLATVFTAGGLEVEAQHCAGPALADVVVAQVCAIKRQPGHVVCQVDDGVATHTVVCNAPNLRSRKLVAWARVGAVLPGERAIERRQIRTTLSEGMICSAADLGLSGGSASEIMIIDRGWALGIPVGQALDLTDQIFDLAVTPNRGDWLSINGLARELAALLELKCRPLRARLVAARRSCAETFGASIEAASAQACRRFCCLPITAIAAGARTPTWLAERLRRCGVRPVSALVDVTNYVMLLSGQPLHAFDRAKLVGDSLLVRSARPGERLTLLDDSVVDLDQGELCVCDVRGPVALAGVMGGRTSGVSTTTTAIVLEAAHFSPSAVRRQASAGGLSSEAAYRFERGVDPALGPLALALAAKLITQICKGRPGQLTEVGAVPPAPPALVLPAGLTARIIGYDPGFKSSLRVLRRLGFKTSREPRQRRAMVVAPSWRFDVSCCEDLVEEVIRVLGYDLVPVTMPTLKGQFRPLPENLLDQGRARRCLAADGFSEIITYPFVPQAWARDFYGVAEPLRLRNPLSEQAGTMRPGLLGGLVDRAVYNFKRRSQNVLLFELARCFPPTADRDEQPLRLAALGAGPEFADNWLADDRLLDFFALKGNLERLLSRVECTFVASEAHPALQPGRAARISIGDTPIGWLGVLHPRWQEKYDLRCAAVVFELDFAVLAGHAYERRAQAFSRLPLVRRDLALIVRRQVPAADLVVCVKMLGLREIVGVSVFDCYEGAGVAQDARSIGLRLSLQGSEQNLAEAAIDSIVARVAEALQDRFQTHLRGLGEEC